MFKILTGAAGVFSIALSVYHEFQGDMLSANNNIAWGILFYLLYLELERTKD